MPIIKTESGFALLEVLIAFLILALSMTVLMQSLGASAHQHRITEDRLIAGSHAMSLLTNLGLDIPLNIGEQSGSIDERFQWKINVGEPGRSPSYGSDQEIATLRLLDVVISIIWQDAGILRNFEVHTKRLVVVGES